MSLNNLLNKIKTASTHSLSSHISGVSVKQWCSLWVNFIRPNEQVTFSKTLHLFSNNSDIQFFYKQLSHNDKTLPITFPMSDGNIYGKLVTEESGINDLFLLLARILLYKGHKTILCDLNCIGKKLPPVQFITDYSFIIKNGSIFSQHQLIDKLTFAGYQQTNMVQQPGEFHVKGEIVDIFQSAEHFYRMTYFDDEIESIYPVDIQSRRSMRKQEVIEVIVAPTAHILKTQPYKTFPRKNIPSQTNWHKSLLVERNEKLSQLDNGEFFDNSHQCLSLFFEESDDIFSYLQNDCIYYTYDLDYAKENYKEFLGEVTKEFELTRSIFPSPKCFYLTCEDLLKKISPSLNIREMNLADDFLLQDESHVSFSNDARIDITPLRSFLKIKKYDNSKSIALNLKQYLQKHLSTSLYFFAENPEKQKQQIAYFFEIAPDRIKFVDYPFSDHYYLGNDNVILIDNHSFFRTSYSNEKKHSKGQKNRNDIFANQIASLNPGDYVVHQVHGIAAYQGMTSLELRGRKEDFILLHYKDDDKVYVPLYKLNLLQKYASSSSQVTLDSLKSKKFENSKQKARESVKKVAFDLIKMQASRLEQRTIAFNQPGEDYHKFESSFPFRETKDQSRAIEDILSDLTSSKPMDRLICGDVGFGKTEVAMRAAFKAVEEKKQVVVLVPTTILCLQHFNSFVERFHDFPIVIKQLSRLISNKDSQEIMNGVREGKVDILIGTHKVLSDKLKFSDLGLIIVDEEHRFGVNHKEKLKLMKANVPFLTLTATPIPRTLQLAFSGLKDLSLIQTPPLKRLSVQNYIIRSDEDTIRKAIEKELRRGGQVFYIHNKVQSIEEEVFMLQKLAPKARIVFAHGQMKESDLEKRISDFYNKEYDILVATTIIESGIDIPSANTMIINNAHLFGLAQLHQLRGRIGRSDKKAYCYFVVPKFQIRDNAQKRLKALQQYCELGAGFLISQTDLDIRGAGDLVGADQSGHLKSIGVELYFELLDEAINEIKGIRSTFLKDFDFSAYFPTYIDSHYIEDSSTRLLYYKKLSMTWLSEDFHFIKEELIDQFGKIPTSLENLMNVFIMRNILTSIGVKKISIQTRFVALQFCSHFLEQHSQLKDQIIQYFIQRPQEFKIEPNYLIKTIQLNVESSEQVVTFCQDLVENIKKC